MVVPKPIGGSTDYESIAQDPLKYVITSIEKKVRNLDKRKAKLDAYRKKASDGFTLDPDQKAAADKYGEVLGSLDFAKELLKSLEVTMSEVTKVNRKNVRRENLVQEDKENWRVAFVTKATRIMDIFYQNKSIQVDFLNGANGACVLSENEVKLLVEFYELWVMPSYESGTNVLEESQAASNHLYELVEARTKSIMGTTYKDLHDLIEKMSNSDYFEDLQLPNDEPEKQQDENKFEEEASSSSVEEQEATKEDQEVEAMQENVVESSDVSDTVSSPTDFNEDTEFVKTKSFESSKLRNPETHITDWANAPEPEASNVMSFQYSDVAEIQKPEPIVTAPSIQDVLADVQGHCMFLQESMIEHPTLSFMTQQPISTPGMEGIALHSEATNNIMSTNQSYASKSPPRIVKNNDPTNQTAPHVITHESLHGSQQSRSSSISPSAQNTFVDSSYLSQTEVTQDNLGMGQTTFGSQHSQFNENSNNYINENKSYSPYEQPEVQFEQTDKLLHQDITPDPPTSHIPLPNDQQSGYTSYQPPSDENTNIMPIQKSYGDNNSTENNDMQKYASINQAQNQQHGEEIPPTNYEDENAENDRSNNGRQMSGRSRGFGGGNYRQSGGGQNIQGGNYRNNFRQQNRFNGGGGQFDSMGRPNYHNGGGYHNNYNYRGSQENMYMYRRGNSGGQQRRGGGGYQQRNGNSRMSGGGNYNRSRTFNRPQQANEQHVN